MGTGQTTGMRVVGNTIWDNGIDNTLSNGAFHMDFTTPAVAGNIEHSQIDMNYIHVNTVGTASVADTTFATTVYTP